MNVCKMMKKYICLLLLVCMSVHAYAQDHTVLGRWKTIDDATAEAKSIVEIYSKDNQVFGKIVEIFNPEDRDKTCTFCKGDAYNKPLIGLTIIKNLKKDDNEYEGGTVFDPENGKEYRAKIWLDKDNPDRLNVRGYILFLFRTQQWIRI